MTKYSGHDCISTLVDAGISVDDAKALRRISMTLHRWHELECGDSNDYASWCIVRGFDDRKACLFSYFDEGKPYLERHIHRETKPRYESIPDRERGALKRLAKIMAGYPKFRPYIQGDPRGCALYLVPTTGLFAENPSDEYLSANYSRGIAVCR